MVCEQRVDKKEIRKIRKIYFRSYRHFSSKYHAMTLILHGRHKRLTILIRRRRRPSLSRDGSGELISDVGDSLRDASSACRVCRSGI